MTINDFRHKINIQVRYKDVDKQGHVNNANHITYFEIARVQYFKDVLANANDWVKNGVILAKTEINYLHPIFLDDTVYCYTKISSFGGKSFEITNIITKKHKDREVICAEGKSVMVCFNYEKNQTIEIPSAWKEAVNNYEM
jgi:acyl-CoA thioester hydrolase